jgi:hypothetical protein
LRKTVKNKGEKMGLRKWWRGLDPDSRLIVKVFGALVLGGVVVSAIQCGV